ncbi:uncharacterized protein PAC_02521 [Phialocephala subalpina]|uniref:2EXR domain-containing protein n=1 Tax=Phialocephala subalpina TaxID=576137 RepID=A0A1L7WIN8_9HELO|nr:uncharacterized protein PAC_02521 [Phialocephala subalpina]
MPPKPRRLGLGPRKFRFFPDLPLELRLCIWEMVKPDGQLISIDAEYGLDATGERIPDPNGGWVVNKKVVASYKVPSLLHACHDSRIVAQKLYKQHFGDRLQGNGSCVLFFGADRELLAEDLSTREIKCPIEEELPAIAFRNFPRSFWQISPRILTQMGQPKHIYLLRQSGRASTEHFVQGMLLDRMWRSDTEQAKELGYSKPYLVFTTYKKMRAHLKDLSSPDYKKHFDNNSLPKESSSRNTLLA